MKTTLVILLTLITALMRPVRADDTQPKAVTIEERIQQIDVELLLKHYERFKNELFDLHEQISREDVEVSEDQKQANAKRFDYLTKRVTMIRNELENLAARAKKAEPPSTKK